MNAAEFCNMLERQGLDFASGVPCSILKDIISYLSSQDRVPYVSATREDEAMGIAAGAYLAGKSPVVLLQNSGLGNTINPLTSLAIPYKIPVLLVVSWRGYQGNDAPEHLVMGRVTVRLLEYIGIDTFAVEPENPEQAVSAAMKNMRDKGLPSAVILRKGIVK
ncbi:MAG TPA: sulfopyruvate decarboxylase subunit alpha [Dehalococcoidia bacterium]|nr:sulfopyruvate decarboxylase subunit alpha [Dehalococcoidia bacterium]